VTDNDIRIASLDRGQKGIEQSSFRLDSLERRFLSFGPSFKVWWEFLDWADNGVNTACLPVWWCWVIDTAYNDERSP